MTSFYNGESAASLATGLWSYQPVQVPESMYVASQQSRSSDGYLSNASPYISENSASKDQALLAEPDPTNMLKFLSPIRYQTSKNHTNCDNRSYRISQPFPDPSTSSEYQPPHQVCTCTSITGCCTSQVSKFLESNLNCNENLIANSGYIQNADQRYPILENQTMQSTSADYKLQRPSSYNTFIPTQYLTHRYPIYTSIAYNGNETLTDYVPHRCCEPTTKSHFHEFDENCTVDHQNTPGTAYNICHPEASNIQEVNVEQQNTIRMENTIPSVLKGDEDKKVETEYANLNEILESNVDETHVSDWDTSYQCNDVKIVDQTNIIYGNFSLQYDEYKKIPFSQDEVSCVSTKNGNFRF